MQPKEGFEQIRESGEKNSGKPERIYTLDQEKWRKEIEDEKTRIFLINVCRKFKEILRQVRDVRSFQILQLVRCWDLRAEQ